MRLLRKWKAVSVKLLCGGRLNDLICAIDLEYLTFQSRHIEKTPPDCLIKGNLVDPDDVGSDPGKFRMRLVPDDENGILESCRALCPPPGGR